LVIGRHEEDGFQGVPNITLEDYREERALDIDLFISSRLNSIRLEGFDAKSLDQLKAIIKDKAQGTFLWIGLVVNELTEKTSLAALFETVHAVPRGLPEMYKRILRSIAPNDRLVCAKIIRWVALAKRPLGLAELAAAIDTDRIPGENIESKVQYQIKKCRQIIQIRENRAVFVHSSVIDYLLQQLDHTDADLATFKICVEEHHCTLAIRCLECLEIHMDEKACFLSPISRTSSAYSGHLLVPYALEHWNNHACSSSSQFSKIIQRFPDFFELKSGTYKAWLRWKISRARLSSNSVFLGLLVSWTDSAQSQSQDSRIAFAIFSGIPEWCKDIMSETVPWYKRLHYWWYPRCWAILVWMALDSGFEDVTSLLLNSGARIDWTQVLDLAIDQLEPTVIRYIAKLKPGLKSKRYDWELPSHLDLETRDLAAVAMNLKIKHHIANMTSEQDLKSYICLQTAVEYRNSEAIKLLLDAGVPVAEFYISGLPVEKSFLNVLVVAIQASEFDYRIFTTLLENTTVRTDHKSDRHPLNYPLCEAAACGNITALDDLLRHGAEVSKSLGYRYSSHLLQFTPLDLAIVKDQLVAADKLLQHGAQSINALHWAAFTVNLRALNLLLTHKFDPNCRLPSTLVSEQRWCSFDLNGGVAPLEVVISQAAVNATTSPTSIEKVLDTLLQHGAQSDIALQFTIEIGRPELVQLLLLHQYSLNMRVIMASGERSTFSALDHAISLRQYPIKELIQHDGWIEEKFVNSSEAHRRRNRIVELLSEYSKKATGSG
jgi:ankyrin repeat protein